MASKYKLILTGDGNFKIFNTTRNKVVYSGKDTKLGSIINTLEFESRTDLMREILVSTSLLTFKKVMKILNS